MFSVSLLNSAEFVAIVEFESLESALSECLPVNSIIISFAIDFTGDLHTFKSNGQLCPSNRTPSGCSGSSWTNSLTDRRTGAGTAAASSPSVCKTPSAQSTSSDFATPASHPQ